MSCTPRTRRRTLLAMLVAALLAGSVSAGTPHSEPVARALQPESVFAFPGE